MSIASSVNNLRYQQGAIRFRTCTVFTVLMVLALATNVMPREGIYGYVTLFLIGSVYLLRDIMQRLTGQFSVLMPMVMVVTLIHLSSPSPHAMASAYMVGLIYGWAVFSQSKHEPEHTQMLTSALISASVDSCVYLIVTGNHSLIVVHTAVKLLPALIYYGFHWRYFGGRAKQR